MKLRDKILYMSFGAGLVVLGMVLNSLVSGDADAQEGVKDARFDTVFCKNLAILDGYKFRGRFGLNTNGDATLRIYGDDGETSVQMDIDIDSIKVSKDKTHSNIIKVDDTISMKLKYPSLNQFVESNFEVTEQSNVDQ